MYNQGDTNKIDMLLQFILVVAGQESGWDRDLGMIHLIKYAYLADLAYSEKHNGETYTGTPWKFHDFGPWSVEVYNRIEPALEEIGATKQIIPSTRDESDFVRWSIDGDRLFDKLNSQFNFIISGTVQNFVKKFGKDTAALLDYVYRTPPMVKATPGEFLDFTPQQTDHAERNDDTEPEKTPLSVSQRKKRKAKLQELKQRIHERVKSELAEQKECAISPRYDDVFTEGVAWLDSLNRVPIEEGELSVVVSDAVWKSKARFDDDLS